MTFSPAKLRSMPGIKRDGTRLEGDFYVDGQWCRFQRGLPRKIGGYRSVVQNLPQRVYGMNSFSANGSQYFSLGSASQFAQRVINSSGVMTASNDRTPAGLLTDDNNIWQIDTFFDVNYGMLVVAHVAPNMDISSQTDGSVYYGGVLASSILVDSTQDVISGGGLTVGNYYVSFGNDGLVQWSPPNDITSTDDSANPTQQKIVAGRRVRGGGVPAALLWSLDSLIQMTFNDPATNLWDFDTITEESSILSSRGMIEYDGVFYWPGVDRFMMYNGVVRELPNDMNVNFFFDNLNFAQRQKVFAYKVPRFDEIWWCFPFGDATECNHAIVYNVRGNFWFDTPLTEEGRTDGLYAKVYFKPFMVGAEETSDGYDLWQHETGVNSERLGVPQPIISHFETKEFMLAEAEDQPSNKSLSVNVVEPDFVQVGDLEVSIRGRANARSTIIDLPDNTKTITEVAADADEQIIRFTTEFRIVSFKFASNTLDGDYQAGENIAQMQPGDERLTQ